MPVRPALRRPIAWLLIALGWTSLGLGVIGIFVPLLPTTPFVLLAAFLFSKGSERMHQWLRNHPRFGRYVRDWEAEQIIPLVGKLASTCILIPSVGWAIATRDIPPLISIGMVIAVAALMAYIWSRPSARSDAAPADADLNPVSGRSASAPKPSPEPCETPSRLRSRP